MELLWAGLYFYSVMIHAVCMFFSTLCEAQLSQLVVRKDASQLHTCWTQDVAGREDPASYFRRTGAARNDPDNNMVEQGLKS